MTLIKMTYNIAFDRRVTRGEPEFVFVKSMKVYSGDLLYDYLMKMSYGNGIQNMG